MGCCWQGPFAACWLLWCRYQKAKSSKKECLEAGPRRKELQMGISHCNKRRSIYFEGKYSGFLITTIQEVTKAACGRFLEGSMSWQVPLTPCTHPKYHHWLCDCDCSVIHHFNSWFSFAVLRNIFILSCVLIFCSFLFPVLWHLWIYAGSANSNFYYAITLTFNIGQVSRVRQMKLWAGCWMGWPVTSSESYRMGLALCLLCDPA